MYQTHLAIARAKRYNRAMTRKKQVIFLHLKSFLASPLRYLLTLRHFISGTDIKRWSNITNFDTQWDERTRMMAAMVPPGASVLEFGSGREVLGGMLPEGCYYQPSDIVARSERTLVCNLNESFPALDRKWDYIVFSGVLEYIHDLPGLLKQVRANCHQCLLSYAPTDQLQCMTTRMQSGWVNHFTSQEIAQMLREAGFEEIGQKRWQFQTIYHLK